MGDSGTRPVARPRGGGVPIVEGSDLLSYADEAEREAKRASLFRCSSSKARAGAVAVASER